MALKRARSSTQGRQDLKYIPALVCNVDSSHQGHDAEPSFADLRTVLRFLDRAALFELVMELAEVPTENFVETSPLEVIHKAVVNRAAPLKRARKVWTANVGPTGQLAISMFKKGVMLELEGHNEKAPLPPLSPTTQKAAEILCGLSPLPFEMGAGAPPDSTGSSSTSTTDGLLYFSAAMSAATAVNKRTGSLLGMTRTKAPGNKSSWSEGVEDEDSTERTTGQGGRSSHKPRHDAACSDSPEPAPKAKAACTAASKAASGGLARLSSESRESKPLPGACNHCGETESPQWRKGPHDKPHLCNACGTRYLRTGLLQHSGYRRHARDKPAKWEGERESLGGRSPRRLAGSTVGGRGAGESPTSAPGPGGRTACAWQKRT